MAWMHRSSNRGSSCQKMRILVPVGEAELHSSDGMRRLSGCVLLYPSYLVSFPGPAIKDQE